MDISKIKKQLEREQARQRESARKAQMLGAKLSLAARKADTRRKILAGAWALDKAEKSAVFRLEMERELNRSWLSRDDDRALFGFEKLSDEEKQRREIPRGPGRPKNPESEGEAHGGTETREDARTSTAPATREIEAA